MKFRVLHQQEVFQSGEAFPEFINFTFGPRRFLFQFPLASDLAKKVEFIGADDGPVRLTPEVVNAIETHPTREAHESAV